MKVYMVKSWENPATKKGLHGKIRGNPTKIISCSHGKIMGKPNKNPHACRHVLWILLVRSCTVCFVFVLSRLSPWRRFLPRLTWTPPATSPSSSSFRLDLSLRCGGLNSAHASLNTGLVLHILLSFPWLFPFFGVCHRSSICSVASYIQYLIHWLLCRTPFTRITFLNMAFSKAVLTMAFSKTMVNTHALV